MAETREATPTPPLPLSEQALAWLLLALGLDETTVPSRSTIKTARKGGLIARRWDDLVDLVLRTFAAGTPEESQGPEARQRFDARRRGLTEALRHWDDLVCALPRAHALPLAERLHAPLTRWVPEVGIRLGALAAVVATETGKPIEECLWIVEPLDRRFFGRVVAALLAQRFPEQTVEARKAELEPLVDRRTVERWFSGKTAEPQLHELAALAETLGERAEAPLRAARMVARLRADLCGWIGEELVLDLARAVAIAGAFAARQLATRDGIATVLGWFHEELTGPHGEQAYAVLRGFLWEPMLAWSPAELAERLAAAATSPAPAWTAWVLATTMLLVHPRLVLSAQHAHGGPMAMLLGATDFARYVEQHWELRLCVHALLEGGGAIVGSDGASRPLVVSERARAAARRWRAATLRFTPSADAEEAAAADDELLTALIEVLGPDVLAGVGRLGEQLEERVATLMAPRVEPLLTDEDVLRSGGLSLARARRLAEAGDRHAAIKWTGHARTRGAPRSAAELDDLMAILAMIAHSVLDDVRTLRALLRAVPEARSGEATEVLTAGAELTDKLLAQVLEIGDAAAGPAPPLTALVVAGPVALRVALLRHQLGSDEPFAAAGAIVERIAACLDQQPAHGRGCAVVSLWLRCWGADDDEVTKHAVHYGAGAFLEGEWARIAADLGLTEDAG
jgi:hypothetical protein